MITNPCLHLIAEHGVPDFTHVMEMVEFSIFIAAAVFGAIKGVNWMRGRHSIGDGEKEKSVGESTGPIFNTLTDIRADTKATRERTISMEADVKTLFRKSDELKLDIGKVAKGMGKHDVKIAVLESEMTRKAERTIGERV